MFIVYTHDLSFEPATLTPEAEALRSEVREFLCEEKRVNPWSPNSDFGSGFSPAFTKAIATKGWIGMTWPKKYGGHERSMLERYVVTEELLVAGAPVFAHWVADRQSGPLLLRFGTEKQRQEILPNIVAGECFFSIGMSEPDSGSDLVSIRTKAVRTKTGGRLNGAKVWTSNAHCNHWMIALCRTSDPNENRHSGLSQFLVDLKNDGVTVNPIINMLGQHEFNEVVLNDVEIPRDRLIGQEGDGWAQVTSELAYERSGPERFLSNFHIFRALVDEIGPKPTDRQKELIGSLASNLWTLRSMSVSVASMLENGHSPDIEAAIVKDLGNKFERQVIEVARSIISMEPLSSSMSNNMQFSTVLSEGMLRLPSFTIRGGTTEIMRSIIARGLGLR